MNPHSILNLLESLAALAVALRLLAVVDGLSVARTYLIFIAIANGLLSLLPVASALYFYVYIAYTILDDVLSVFAVRELLGIVFNDYPGIRTVGRQAALWALGLSFALSLALTRTFWNGGAHGRSIGLFYLEMTNRSVVLSLAVVIVTVLMVISRYPLHLSPNLVRSTVFFSAFFLSEAVQLLIDSLAPHLYIRYVDLAQDAFAAAGLFSWAFALRRETAHAGIPVPVPDFNEQHLLDQLTSLNELLAKSARRS